MHGDIGMKDTPKALPRRVTLLAVGVSVIAGYLATLRAQATLPQDIQHLVTHGAALSVSIDITFPDVPKDSHEHRTHQADMATRLNAPSEVLSGSVLHLAQLRGHGPALRSAVSNGLGIQCASALSHTACAPLSIAVTTDQRRHRDAVTELHVVAINVNRSEPVAYALHTTAIIFGRWSTTGVTITPEVVHLIQQICVGKLNTQTTTTVAATKLNQAVPIVHYHVAITVLDETSTRETTWQSFTDAFEAQVDPLLTSLLPAVDVTVSSSTLSSVNDTPHPTRDATEGTFLLPMPALDMKHWLSGMPRPNIPNGVVELKHLVYVPHPHQSPLELRIRGRPVRDNTATVPGWGSVHLVKYNGTTHPQGPEEVQSSAIVHHIIRQLRHLIDAPRPRMVYGGNPGVLEQWEINRLCRRIAITRVTAALDSLSALLAIAKLSTEDVDAGMASHAAAATDALGEVPIAPSALSAISSASRACLLAEGAWLPGTSAKRTYFPADQKYAIYVPYIVPAGAALLGGLIHTYKVRQ